jgi:GNAT superfamily N-acetyltransferase
MEKLFMKVRLSNLSARPPAMIDLEMVTALIAACDAADSGIADPTEDDVLRAWQAPGFNLRTDAWMIVANKNSLIGYADVRYTEEGQLIFSAHVHPDYRRRGVGTLLVWLAEERARQLAQSLPARVTLQTTISSLNVEAKRLLEREGYTPVRNFWRLLIEMDEDASSAENSGGGKIKMDLVLDSRSMRGVTPLARRTGMYVVRQYDVYEKVLRSGEEQTDMQRDTQIVPV